MIVIPRITSKQISLYISRTFLKSCCTSLSKNLNFVNTIVQKSPKENDWLINFVNYRGTNAQKIDIAVLWICTVPVSSNFQTPYLVIGLSKLRHFWLKRDIPGSLSFLFSVD